MSDVSIEKKLELIRSIREADSRNRSSLKQQQSILYGGKRGYSYDNYVINVGEDTTDPAAARKQKRFSTLGLRCLLAVLLFSGYVILDYTDAEWFFVNSSKAFSYIEENYSSNGFAFIREITYTLNGFMNTENRK